MFLTNRCISSPFYLVLDNALFTKQVLVAHNYFREIHNVAPLGEDEALRKGAQLHAEYLAKRGSLVHPLGLKVGENLAMKCAGPQENGHDGDLFTTLW